MQSSLDNVSKGRTVLIIAHRLSTVQNADMIVVLHNGVIVEVRMGVCWGMSLKCNGLKNVAPFVIMSLSSIIQASSFETSVTFARQYSIILQKSWIFGITLWESHTLYFFFFNSRWFILYRFTLQLQKRRAYCLRFEVHMSVNTSGKIMACWNVTLFSVQVLE